MSSTALPITPTRFASALTTLPLSSLYAKHAELSNQIAHLEASNQQLEAFARDNDDRECYEALLENREVLARFEERRGLIVREVGVVRGLPWRPDGEEGVGVSVAEGDGNGNGRAAGVEGAMGGGEVRRGGDGAGDGDGDGEGNAGEDGVFL
ncbi:hypothetical protein J1614_009025 [Plenodomus biglobosus]|nr:hypothetical protein J1614_009025 [Plenodomus biglobosus]